MTPTVVGAVAGALVCVLALAGVVWRFGHLVGELRGDLREAHKLGGRAIEESEAVRRAMGALTERLARVEREQEITGRIAVPRQRRTLPNE